MRSRQAWASECAQDQPELHGETLSHETNNNKEAAVMQNPRGEALLERAERPLSLPFLPSELTPGTGRAAFSGLFPQSPGASRHQVRGGGRASLGGKAPFLASLLGDRLCSDSGQVLTESDALLSCKATLLPHRLPSCKTVLAQTGFPRA